MIDERPPHYARTLSALWLALERDTNPRLPCISTHWTGCEVAHPDCAEQKRDVRVTVGGPPWR